MGAGPSHAGQSLQGGEFIAAGSFKCVFDKSTLFQITNSTGDDAEAQQEFGCGDHFAALVAEKHEFDKEDVFANSVVSNLPSKYHFLVRATLGVIPKQRRELSSSGLAALRRQVPDTASCKKIFKNPTQLQVVCMGQGVPLRSRDLLFTIWNQLMPHPQPSPPPPNTSGDHVVVPPPPPTSIQDLRGSLKPLALVASKLLGDVALGLFVLEHARICHCDMKSNNILLLPHSATQAMFRPIDFGLSQSVTKFVNSGFRRLGKKEFAAWYNPLCRGIVLLLQNLQNPDSDADEHTKHSSRAVSTSSDEQTSSLSASTASPSYLRQPGTINNNNTTDQHNVPSIDLDGPAPQTPSTPVTKDAVKRALAQHVSGQVDKYSFMYVVWSLARSAKGHKEVDDWKRSLYDLILSCRNTTLPPVVNSALEQVQLEFKQNKQTVSYTTFTQFMLNHDAVFFKDWPEIYTQIIEWRDKMHPDTSNDPQNLHLPQTIHKLARSFKPKTSPVQTRHQIQGGGVDSQHTQTPFELQSSIVKIDVVKWKTQTVVLIGEHHFDEKEGFPLVGALMERAVADKTCLDYFLETQILTTDTYTARPKNHYTFNFNGGDNKLRGINYLRNTFAATIKTSPFLRLHKTDTRSHSPFVSPRLFNALLAIDNANPDFGPELVSVYQLILNWDVSFDYVDTPAGFVDQFAEDDQHLVTKLVDQLRDQRLSEDEISRGLNYMMSMKIKLKKQWDNIEPRLQPIVHPMVILPVIPTPIVSLMDMYTFYRLVRQYPPKPYNMYDTTCGPSVDRALVYEGVQHINNIHAMYNHIGAYIVPIVQDNSIRIDLSHIPDVLFGQVDIATLDLQAKEAANAQQLDLESQARQRQEEANKKRELEKQRRRVERDAVAAQQAQERAAREQKRRDREAQYKETQRLLVAARAKEQAEALRLAMEAYEDESDEEFE